MGGDVGHSETYTYMKPIKNIFNLPYKVNPDDCTKTFVFLLLFFR